MTEAVREAEIECPSEVPKLDAGSSSTQNDIMRLFDPSDSSPFLSCMCYSPLFVSQHDQNLIGYESTVSKRWFRLPTMSYLPQLAVDFKWNLRAAYGSLFCWTSESSTRDIITGHEKVLVTNPLTTTFRILPAHPKPTLLEFVSVVLRGTNDYKVFLGSMFTDGQLCICIQIFDSTTDLWTATTYPAPAPTLANLAAGAIVNGVLRMLVRAEVVFGTETTIDVLGVAYRYSLVSLDLNRMVWQETRSLFGVYLAVDGVSKLDTLLNLYLLNDFRSSQLLVCQRDLRFDLMLVALHKEVNSNYYAIGNGGPIDENDTHLTLSIFRLDANGRALEVSRAPQAMVNSDFESAACIGDCIYIGARFPSSSSVLYNVRTREWDRFNSVPDMLRPFNVDRDAANVISQWQWTTPIKYEPGWNPTLHVG